jgi:excisionase family DNA binding protein
MARRKQPKSQRDESRPRNVVAMLTRMDEKLDGVSRLEQKLDEFAKNHQLQNPYLLVAEAAAIAKVRDRTVHRWINKGILPASRITGTGKKGPYRIERKALDALMVKIEHGELRTYRFTQRSR